MALFKVETISQFRMVYFVEAKEKAHAEDEIVMRDSGAEEDFFDEAAQQHLGEVIFSSEEISREQFETFLDNNKSITSHWMGDKLIRHINYHEELEMNIDFAHTDEEHISHNVFSSMAQSLIAGRPRIADEMLNDN